jgi:eukaryotic-like serine/threonine-protein kinase
MALSSVPGNSEEGRAFLQQRLALFGKSVFLLFLGVAVLALSAMLIFEPQVASRMRHPPYHFVGVAAVGALWQVCRKGKLSLAALDTLDAVTVLVVGVAIGMIIWGGAPDIMPQVPATLGITHLMLGRAVIVPSRWQRTMILGVLGALPPIAMIIHDAALGVSVLPRVWVFLLPTWMLLAVAMAAFTSHVLYTLRRSVAEARQLGQYTLEDKIGEGGMGIVHRARHAMLRRPTVVKLLPPDRAGGDNIARFEREVQLTSRLTSPNTVAIYDFGRTPEGIFYYAMEYLDGVDLERLVEKSGAQPPGRVIHVLADACSALTEAHESGLIHRDIKPGNIMLCRHGGAYDVVKVLDFGLVKDLTVGSNIKLTQADTLLGTPLYLSPEAITDPDTVDARSDLYALGAVGYFLLTGKPVFEGRSVAEVSAHHIHTPPAPLSRHAANVPEELETVLLSCLEKSPEARPASARALRSALLGCQAAGTWTEDDARAWWLATGR